MFTGIVEQIGAIVAVEEHEDGRKLRISADGITDLPVGASVAVNGVCLTVVDSGATVAVDVIPETLARTNLGSLSSGDRVNLERAMAATGRFDGHIVQGHVDGTGTVTSITEDQHGVVMSVEAGAGLVAHLVEKGSITVDGVSLTIAGLEEREFSVALIPHTLAVTILGLRKTGDVVNLEIDVIAKYVERLLKAHT